LYQILKPNKYITVIKIPIKNIEKIEVIMANQPKETVSNCFNRLKDKPNFIINGGLFNMSDGSTITTTVDEGQLIRDGLGNFFGLKIFKDLSFIWEAYKKGENIKDFIGCSPSLVINGKVDIRNPLDSGFMNGRHPRLAIGSNKDFFFVVSVDGRRLWAKGMTILELAKYMLSLNITNALNLDGGGSLRLGQNINGILKILNSPTENRAVDNFVGFYLKESISPTISYPTIRKGSKGEYVKLMQKLLNQKGFNAGIEDGIAGRQTILALKEFQKKNGLYVDGICGMNSWTKLNEIV